MPLATTPSPAQIHLSLLGGFRAERDGRPLPDAAWQRRSGKSLVKLLAVEPAHQLHREQVQDFLWPESDPAAAANAFRKALHLARHALEPDLAPKGVSAYLRFADDVVALDSSHVSIDVDRFETVAARARAAGDPAAFEAALAAYTGELLPEDRYEDWAAARRAELADLHETLLVELADLLEQRGAVATAAERLRQILTLDPAREEVHRRLMRLYAAGGSRHRALRQYETCREALRRELDADPSAETESLRREIVAGRVAPAPRPEEPPAVTPPLPGAIRRLTATPLVGRERVVELLRDELGRAAAGEGGTIVVTGDAGIGKSRLVAEVAHDAHRQGFVVLTGGSYEQEGKLPYAPFVEALDGYLSGLTPALRDRFRTDYPELVGLLPSLPAADVPEPTSPNADDRRARLFAAVVRLLTNLSRERPLFFAVEDLHAAESASLQLLHHLARAAVDRSWLLLGTYREEDVAAGSEFQRWCAAAMRDGLCRRVDLLRLGRAESDRLVQSLLSGPVDPATLERLYARALGHPLFTVELIDAARERGEITLLDGRWQLAAGGEIAVPRQVRDLIAARVDRLGEPVRDALALAATAGMESSFPLLRAAGDLDDAALLDALDGALAAHILDEREEGYVFRHPLLRAALYERLSRARRAALHAALATAIERRLGDALDDRAAEVEMLAHHWTESAEPARAIPYLIRAGDQAARVFANDEAIARYRRALALLDRLHPAEATSLRAAILERLGDVQAWTGDAAAARTAFDGARTTAGIASLAAARLGRKAAHQSLLTGDVGGAETRLGDALRLLDAADTGEERELERARLLSVVAHTHFLAFRFPEALAAAEESAQLAEAYAAPAERARAYEMIAIACLPLGDWQRGFEYERRRAELADLHREIVDLADVHLCLADYHLYGEQPVAAARDFASHLEEARRMGATRCLAVCHYYLGTAAYAHGRFREAVPHLTEAVQLYRSIDSAAGEAIALMVRGVTQTALGRFDAAQHDLEHGLSLTNQASLRSHAAIRLYAGLASSRLDADDPAGALHYAELGLSLAEDPSRCICYAAIHPAATTAYALTGDLERAVVLSERTLQQAHAFGSPYFLCMAHQAEAMVHLMRGDFDGAFRAVDDALRHAEAHDLRYEVARTRMLRAFVHLQRGDAEDAAAAHTLTSVALPVFRRLGAHADAARAIATLRSLGTAQPATA